MRSDPFSEVSKAQRRRTRAHSAATTTAWLTALGGGAALLRLRELGEARAFIATRKSILPLRGSEAAIGNFPAHEEGNSRPSRRALFGVQVRARLQHGSKCISLAVAAQRSAPSQAYTIDGAPRVVKVGEKERERVARPAEGR